METPYQVPFHLTNHPALYTSPLPTSYHDMLPCHVTMTCTLSQHYAHLSLGITTMKIQLHLPINLPSWTTQSMKNPPTFQPSIIANNAIAGVLHICRDFRRHLRYEVYKVDELVSAFDEKIIALIEFSKERMFILFTSILSYEFSLLFTTAKRGEEMMILPVSTSFRTVLYILPKPNFSDFKQPKTY